MLEHLSRIADKAMNGDPSEGDVLTVTAIIARALSAEDAYIVRSGDPHFVRIGSHQDPAEYDIKQRGFWLMWQELARHPHLPGLITNVEDRMVLGGAGLLPHGMGNYIAALLPGDESNSEMLIVRRKTSNAVTAQEVVFVQAVRPMLSQMLGRLLDKDRQERHRSQLAGLSDVARAFSNASRESALDDVATAIAKASGFDWVTVQVYDDKGEMVEMGGNLARHSGTETALMARDGRFRNSMSKGSREAFRATMLRGEPRLLPDVFAPDSGVGPEMRAYFQRAHILSSASFPLMFQASVLGVVTFSSSIQRSFEEDLTAFLSDLAAQAATAVSGIRLYRELERKNAEIQEYAEQLEEASQVEHFLARTDALTGLPNRRYLEEVLKAEFAKASRWKQPLSVVMADLDHFKGINDSSGHLAGDEALRFVSRVARESARQSDFVGRWGGDEFLFVLPGCGLREGHEVAEGFRGQLASVPFMHPESDEPRTLRVSAGVAETDFDQKHTESDLVDWADKALYEAKETGRDQVKAWQAAARAA